jgi:transposase InsO family protein
MPWNGGGVVEARKLFVTRVLRGGISVKDACVEFNITRACGHKWLRRFIEDGLSGFDDRSRRPLRVRSETASSLVTLILSERNVHPAWGARKIGKRLEVLGFHPPAERTINRILSRHDLIRRRVKAKLPPQHFERSTPNELWQMDHKASIWGRWRSRSVPFLVVDDCSRFLLTLVSLPSKGLSPTWDCLWEVFGEFGLPEQILSDNDIVFAGRIGPSQLESRLLRLGIEVLHGRPRHPQTQGKVERLNGTLSAELLRDGDFESARDLQAGFDHFRSEYNYIRPHEALDLAVPGSRYIPSPRRRPERLPMMEYCSGALVRKVDSKGRIRWGGEGVDVGRGLAGEWVEVRSGENLFEVYYGAFRILGFGNGIERRRRSYRRLSGIQI